MMLLVRHTVNSIPELELMVNSRIGIDYLKKDELELRNFELELKFPTKKMTYHLWAQPY